MSRLAVLLRGINVGAHNRLAMRDLQGVLEAVGGRDVTTYLQSGNAVLDADESGLGPRIEDALRGRFGMDIAVFVRTSGELTRVVDKNPFPQLVSSPKLLHVAFLQDRPDKATVRALGARHGDDEVALGDRVLYLAYSKSSIDSPLVAALRPLSLRMTARNWTTVTKILALTQPS